MKTTTISSATIFKTLTDLAARPGTRAGTKLNAVEVKFALDSFGWRDGKVTRAEVIAAHREFTALKAHGKLTTDGEKAFSDWFAQTGVGAPGGLEYTRSADAFRNLESVLRYGADSQKGATLTKAEASSLLSVLGPMPSPARIAEVEALRDNLKSQGKSRDAQTVLNTWLKANPIARPSEPLNGQLGGLVKGVLWPSETDRPLIPVNLGAAPSSRQSVFNAIRTALGESTTTPVEVRDFDETFNQIISNADPADPASVASAAKFTAIRDALKAKLTDLKVIRVGTIDIDLFAVGKDSKGQWVGVMSGVVET